MHIIAGVDLAWMGTRNPTAIAVGRVTPGVVELSRVIENLHGTQAVMEAVDGIQDLHGIAIDGPLIITNQSGQRECERKIGVAYGARKASCHTSNLGRFPDAAGTRLSSHLSGNGFRHLAPVDEKWQVECYPHPALIEIFGLAERLAYKKGSVDAKRCGQIKLGKLILSLEESNVVRLGVPDAFRIHFDAGRIASLQGGQLKHNEDVLDAVVCMYIGALYQSGQEQTVFGTTSDGYIYVPTTRCIPHGKPPIPHAAGDVPALTISDACGPGLGSPGTPLGNSDMTTPAERLKRVIALLCKHKQRATYGAVGGYVGLLPIAVMANQPKNWENSWVVSVKSKMPSGYNQEEMAPDLKANSEVIETPERLAEWIAEHTPSTAKHAIPYHPGNDPNHPIPYLQTIDACDYREGKATLSIIVASPLAADERSKTRLLGKLQFYLECIQTEAFAQRLGTAPTPENTIVAVHLHRGSAGEVWELLGRCRALVNSKGASLLVSDLTAT